MKFTTTRNIDNNVFSVTIAYKEYGTVSLTAEEEKEILESYPVDLSYSDITFTGNYTLTGKEVTAGGTDSLTLSLSNKKVKIDETFSVTYRVDSNSIPKSSYSSNTNLNTAELAAQGYCKLFEDKVKEKLESLLTTARNKFNDFESVDEYTI